MGALSAGIGYIIFVTAKDLASKKASFSLSGSLLAFTSFAFAIPYFLLLLPLLWFAGYETFAVSTGFLGFIVIRALSDTAAEWTKMESIARSDISLMSSFQSISPAFLAIFSPLITGDPLRPSAALGLVIITLSGILIANPFGKHELTGREIKGILFSLASAFFFSINHCVDRLAAQTASATFSAFMMTLIAGVFVYVAARLYRVKCAEQFKGSYRTLLVRGAFETMSLISKIALLQYVSAPSAVAIGRLSVLLSIVMAALIFHERDTLRRFIFGGTMVYGCVITLLG